MGFYLKRFWRALRVHKKWMLLVLPALALYLVYAALTDVDFLVSQEFSPYFSDTPVAAGDSPVAVLRAGDLVADPEVLFLDGFALSRLQKDPGLLAAYGGQPDEATLRRILHSDLTLAPLQEPAGLRLSYEGQDEALGRALVVFYTERLMKRVEEGMARAQRTGDSTAAVRLRPLGDLIVVVKKTPWSPERLAPAIGVLILAFVGVMVLIVILELSDPSFKSERQMARYLGVPVLGAIPDAGPLAKRLASVGAPSPQPIPASKP